MPVPAPWYEQMQEPPMIYRKMLLRMIGTWGGWLAGFRAERWHLTGLSLAGFAVLAALCLSGAGTDQRHWRWLWVVTAGIAFLISCVRSRWCAPVAGQSRRS